MRVHQLSTHTPRPPVLHTLPTLLTFLLPISGALVACLGLALGIAPSLAAAVLAHAGPVATTFRPTLTPDARTSDRLFGGAHPRRVLPHPT